MVWFKPSVKEAVELIWGGSDLDASVSESGVVHENTQYTDFTDSSILKQGYSIQNPEVSLASGAGQDYFASDGMSQPTHGINAPESFYSTSENSTFLAYQGQNLDPAVVEYDHDTGEYLNQTVIGSNPLTNDDHGGPAINATSDGTLHAFWGAHQDPMKYAQSDNAWDTSSWTTQSDIGSETTYPIPVVNENNDDIYLFLRERADDYSTTNNVPETIYKSTDGGSTWTEIGPIIDFGNAASDSVVTRIYLMGFRKNGTEIHIAWNYYRSDDATRYNVYHARFDMADDSLTSQDGSSLSTPITKSSADSNCRVLETESSSEKTNFTRVGLDSNANPHILFTHNTGSLNYRYSYWTGSGWSSPTTITGVGAEFSSGQISPTTSTDIDAYLSVSSNSERGGDLERWNYDGTSWTLQETILSKSNSGEDINHPKVTRPAENSELSIVFSQSDEGDYTNSDLKVYAWGDQGLVQSGGTAATSEWPLHEDSGSTIHDVRGPNDGATQNTPTLGQTGVLGTTSIGFNSSNSEWCDLGGDTFGIADGTVNEFTLLAWVYWTGATTGAEGVVRGPFETGTAPGNPVYALFIADGSPRAMFQSTNNNFIGTPKTGSLAQNEWKLLAGTYDGSELTMFVDAAVNDTTTTSEAIYDASGLPLGHAIGAFKQNQGVFFNGRIANVRVDSRAYSQSEIQDVYDVAVANSSLITDTKVK